MKQKVLLYLFLGASVFLLSFASIGLWHWYWESHYWNSKREAAKKEAVEPEGYGAGDLIDPPEPFRPKWVDDNAKKGYPIHWGPEPNIQTRDYRKLPEPFGHGSSTLFNWIKKNQEQDAKNK
jgi:hypothetical protein